MVMIYFSFVSGVFSLRDMYEQFQNIMKMGPFGQIMVSGGGQGGGRPGEKGREVYGKWDYKNGGKWEKKGKIMQHCTIFHNGKNAKRQEPTNTGREPGLKGMGSRRFKPPPPHW